MSPVHSLLLCVANYCRLPPEFIPYTFAVLSSLSSAPLSVHYRRKETVHIPIVMTPTETRGSCLQIPRCLLEDFAILIKTRDTASVQISPLLSVHTPSQWCHRSDGAPLADATKDSAAVGPTTFQRPFQALMKLVINTPIQRLKPHSHHVGSRVCTSCLRRKTYTSGSEW